MSADAEVQNANGEPCDSAKEDKPVKPIPETAGDQAVQLPGSVSIVLEGAANEDAKLESLGIGQALSPAWSYTQASTSASASTELMYFMPPHAPGQNAALAYASLEQLHTGPALSSPAWSDTQASTSASTEPELMYSMPPHAPGQNAALAYDSHAYFERQEPSLL